MNRIGQYLVTAAIIGVYAAHYMGVGPAWSEGDMRLQDGCLMLVIGYWLGSSDGSAKKTDIMHADHQGKDNA